MATGRALSVASQQKIQVFCRKLAGQNVYVQMHTMCIVANSISSQDLTMKYMLLIAANEAGFAQMTPTDVSQTLAAYQAYGDAMVQAGVRVDGNRLKPAATATTLRVRNGKTEVQDGPFADTKEQLGGYYIIDVPALDDALSWAARCPGAQYGTMEVRPVWEM